MLRRWTVGMWLLVINAVLAVPVIARAQEATLSGTVTDSTGGVLPGVTVRAVHEASGNSFEVVTDERGGYWLPVDQIHEHFGWLKRSRMLEVREQRIAQSRVLKLAQAPRGGETFFFISLQSPLTGTLPEE